jgi:hypothetical protein
MAAIRAAHATQEDKVLVAASGFTSLWALTWLSSGAMAAGAVAQGGFAVGSVMAGGGLAALWWKTRAIRSYQDAAEEAEGDKPERTAEA